MIVKILGSLDIITAICFFVFRFFNFIPEIIIMILAFYLLIKGLVFLISKDAASMLDVVCAGIIFLSFNFIIPAFVVILVALFLLEKGILSLAA